jgi:opine dehydrogenase
LSDFEAVVAALSSAESEHPVPAPTWSEVAVLGSGTQAWAFAAGFHAGGARVRWWVSLGEEAARLSASGISVRGGGPIGNYAVDSDANHAIRPTPWIDQAVTGADLVVVVGSLTDQRAVGMRLAGLLSEGQTVMISPGRTFGALEMAWWLRAGGSYEGLTLVELQTCPFTVDTAGPGRLRWSESSPSGALAAYPADRGQGAREALAGFFPAPDLLPTVLHTSLTESSWAVVPQGILEGPITKETSDDLLPGAVSLPQPPVPSGEMESLVGALREERASVAARWGVRSPQAAINDVASAADGQVARDSVLDGTAGSLVALCSAAALGSVPVPVTSSLVTLVSTMCGRDLRAEGRRLEAMGWAGADLDAIRRTVGRAG